MGLSEEALAEAKVVAERLEAAKGDGDKRAVVCGCGHTIAKHEETRGVWLCIQGYGKCPCRRPRAVLKVPNARLFSFRNDDAGPALVKGIAKTVELEKGHRLDWVASCVDCDQEPVTVAVTSEGRDFEPRCGVHK